MSAEFDMLIYVYLEDTSLLNYPTNRKKKEKKKTINDNIKLTTHN